MIDGENCDREVRHRTRGRRSPLWPVTTVDRPIFVVGCGRSGTTLLYNIVCGHPELAWFNWLTNRWPHAPAVAATSRLQRRPSGELHRWSRFFAPSEGQALWDRVRIRSGGALSGPLTEDDVLEREPEAAKSVVVTHLRAQGKPRFINKNTTNTIRMRYLDRLFTDAHFVHLIRDPRAVVASLLNVSWWPDLPVWCCGDRTPTEWVRTGNRPETLAAELWRREVEVALADREHLAAGRYLEIRYEDLVADPRATTARVLEFAGLRWSDQFETSFRRIEVSDANRKFRADFSQDQLSEIERVAGPLACTLGYDLSSR